MNLIHTVRFGAGLATIALAGWCCWSIVRWALAVPGRLAAWYRQATADPPVTAWEDEAEVPTPALPALDDEQPVEHVEVDERGMAGYVAPVLLDLDETPAGPLLCDQPARPEPDTELWWAIRLATCRRNDARRVAALGRGLPPWFAALVAREDELLAAEFELFHHLTDTVFESTAEHQLVGARR